MRENAVASLIAAVLVFGNINVNDRIVFQWEDGKVSTVLSKSFAIDDQIVLLPTIVHGRPVSDKEAVGHYNRTGEHLGIFNSQEEAKAFAERLHNQQEEMCINQGF